MSVGSETPPIPAERPVVHTRWFAPAVLVSLSLLLLAVGYVRSALKGFGVAGVTGSVAYGYVVDAATIVGWLGVAVVAIVVMRRLRSDLARSLGSLLQLTAIGASLLAVAAGLNLAVGVVVQAHSRQFIADQSVLSLLQALERAAACVTTLAWLAVAVGVAVAVRVLRKEHSGGGTAVSGGETVALVFAGVAAVGNVISSGLTFGISWLPSSSLGLGWVNAIYGALAAAWLAASGAALSLLAVEFRAHKGIWWTTAFPVGAMGFLAIALSTVCWIATYQGWWAEQLTLADWQIGLAAGGWCVLAVAGSLLAVGVKASGRPRGVRAPDQPRWWIREVLANRSHA